MSQKKKKENKIRKSINKIISMGQLGAVAVFLPIAFVCVLVSLISCGMRIGYSLDYSGKSIGNILKKANYDIVVKKVCEQVEGQDVESQITAPEFSLCIVNKNRTSDYDKLAKKVMENSNNIISGYCATTNGNSYIYPCESKEDIVENYLLSFNVKALNSVSRFTQNVDIKKGYYLLKDISSGSLSNLISSIPVETVAVTCENVKTEYKTVTLKSNEMIKGTVKVQTEGSTGLNSLTQQVKYIDGVEISRKTISQKVLTKPVNRVVIEGTADSTRSAYYSAKAHNAGFVFPLPKGSYHLGDGYGYSSGRNHKGYDLLAPYGTNILAVKEGTVIRSSWYKGYGYCVDIRHSGGLVTRYGHCSSLLKRVGDKVSAGDIIAKVGSTGDSDGNHVHFEVLKNGSRVDPTAYLKLD